MSVKKFGVVRPARAKLSFFDDTTTSILRLSAKASQKEEKHQIKESVESLDETPLTNDVWLELENTSHED